MSDRQVIVGAGPVGRELAAVLAARGDEVTVVTRSGRQLSGDNAGIVAVAADASDPDRLSELAQGATAVFNCANPVDYTRWTEVWPPLSESLLVAAERSGATLVTASSLYGYGPVSAPMVEGQPDLATDTKGRIRAGMWAEAKARHDAGRLHAVEVRASDYLGPGVGQNGHVTRHLPAARQGRTAWVIGRPDLPHTWSDVGDVARTLVAVADRPDSWGQVWHVPSNEPRSQRQALTDVLGAGGLPAVKVRGIPDPVLAGIGLFSPLMREVRALSYMFRRSYEMASEHTARELGLEPTPWVEVCRRTVSGN